MGRKMMSREVTTTKVNLAKMEMVDGLPKAVQLPPFEIIGNVSLEKAQKEVHKELGKDVTVFSVEADTVIYEMPVEEFIKVASIKQPETEVLPESE